MEHWMLQVGTNGGGVSEPLTVDDAVPSTMIAMKMKSEQARPSHSAQLPE